MEREEGRWMTDDGRRKTEDVGDNSLCKMRWMIEMRRMDN